MSSQPPYVSQASHLYMLVGTHTCYTEAVACLWWAGCVSVSCQPLYVCLQSLTSVARHTCAVVLHARWSGDISLRTSDPPSCTSKPIRWSCTSISALTSCLSKHCARTVLYNVCSWHIAERLHACIDWERVSRLLMIMYGTTSCIYSSNEPLYVQWHLSVRIVHAIPLP